MHSNTIRQSQFDLQQQNNDNASSAAKNCKTCHIGNNNPMTMYQERNDLVEEQRNHDGFQQLCHKQMVAIQDCQLTAQNRDQVGPQDFPSSMSSSTKSYNSQQMMISQSSSSPQTLSQPQSSVVEAQNMRVTGIVKLFFPENKYGFLIGDTDGKDVFYHMDDICSDCISVPMLQNACKAHNYYKKGRYTLNMYQQETRKGFGGDRMEESSHGGMDQQSQMINPQLLRFSFNKLAYLGKYGLSMKAINIKLEQVMPLVQSTNQSGGYHYQTSMNTLNQQQLTQSYGDSNKFNTSAQPFSPI